MNSLQVEIVYFVGCPSAATAFEALKKNSIPFGITIQDRLPKDDPKRALTSPSIYVNGVRVVGEAIPSGEKVCTLKVSAEELVSAVRAAMQNGQPSAGQR